MIDILILPRAVANRHPSLLKNQPIPAAALEAAATRRNTVSLAFSELLGDDETPLRGRLHSTMPAKSGTVQGDSWHVWITGRQVDVAAIEMEMARLDIDSGTLIRNGEAIGLSADYEALERSVNNVMMTV